MADTPVAFDAATVVGSLQDPVFAITTDGDVAFANRRFLEITRFDREALVGADYRIVADVIEEGFENVEHAFALVATGRSDEERAQMQMDHPEDAPVPRQMPAEGRFTPVRRDGDIAGVAVSFRNITERVERERELERQNERLDRFASVVSHDLRNPLNVASGHLELARENCEDDNLDSVASAHERMQSLVDGLLTLARSGERDPDCEAASLEAAVRRAWAGVETADATLDCRTEGRVLADPSRLGQLFENLFRNAVEHGGDDVTVTVGDLDDGFYVEDDGPGIPADEREDVFEPGYSNAADGTGLGLAIVEQTAAGHDWTLTVSESSAGGARFEITDVESP